MTRKNLGTCVVCRVRLKPQDTNANVQQCPNCHKDYFLTSEIVDIENDVEFDHDSEDTELSGIQSITDGGLLISGIHEFDSEDLRLKQVGNEPAKNGGPKDYLRKLYGDGTTTVTDH